jgi:hypothetical protein
MSNSASRVALALLAIGLASAGGCLETKAARQQAETDAARAKGTLEAKQDIDRGVLKQKEYPPLPYSLQQINFIKLIKSECGVEWQVVNGPDSPALRQEVAAYNDAMRGEIQRRFGADIIQKLHEKAEAK